MKPINLILFSATFLLLVAGISVSLGWYTHRASLLALGRNALVGAFVIASIPLVAGVAYLVFSRLKRNRSRIEQKRETQSRHNHGEER